MTTTEPRPVTVDTSALMTALRTADLFVSTDTLLPVLAVVELHYDGRRLAATASDRYTLGHALAALPDLDQPSEPWTAYVRHDDIRLIRQAYQPGRRPKTHRLHLYAEGGALRIVPGPAGRHQPTGELPSLRLANPLGTDARFPELTAILREARAAVASPDADLPGTDMTALALHTRLLARFDKVPHSGYEPMRLFRTTRPGGALLVEIEDWFTGLLMPCRFGSRELRVPADAFPARVTDSTSASRAA